MAGAAGSQFRPPRLVRAVRLLPSVGLFVAAMVVLVAVAIPLALHFGFAKVQIGFMVLIVIGILPAQMGGFRLPLVGEIGSVLSNMGQSALVAGLVAMLLAVLAVSYRVSARIYQHKDI